MQILKTLFNKTINNVIFGITLMVLVAGYIAIGSGIPEVREHFEMNELQFFAAWPIKVLMVLLVINLLTVTWTRIPLTPPRYGVWCIHLGIITLIFGLAGYYANKIEGQVRIPLGAKVDHFYDNFERALYVKLNGEWSDTLPLHNLPRFNEYGEEHRNVASLNKSGLRDIVLGSMMRDGDTGEVKRVPFHEAYGWKNELKVDIVGYWPYASVATSFATDPESKDVGLRLAMVEPHSNQPQETWLMGSDARHRQRTLGDGAVEVEHRHQEDENIVEGLKNAASQVLQVTFNVGDKKGDTFVEVGKTYPLGDTGYAVQVESYNPSWPMFGTNEMVRAMTFMVMSPTAKYRRMVLEGKPVQTDFKLDEPGGGPMGKRQTEPLDKALTLGFAVTDPFRLMPREATKKHTFITTGDGKMFDVAVAADGPSKITEIPGGRGTVDVTIDHSGRGPFQPPPEPGTSDSGHMHTLPLSVARVDQIVKDDMIIPVPSAQRQRDLGAAGLVQVVRAKLSMGQWSKTVLVPFMPDAGENMDWNAPIINLPEGGATVQLTLCNSRLRLPAELTLEHFELVPYPGGDANAPNALIRDFRSTLIVNDPNTKVTTTAVAHMNNPVYFDSGRWLFFQAAYDGDGKQWTILGVGNRPGVWVMTIGCVMIFVGLMYAFYLKPIIIRRMKANAIAEAADRKAKAAKAQQVAEPELVAT
ncbi:MAG TPA: hypothetical protein VGN72_13695 [Tepidisphaeraceae bacterium]|jgi:hypothetical protein|nr:hypothetical protein [Tepidisphaeraceae bacterium]